MLSNKMFLVTEVFHTYASGLSASAVAAATIVWQTNKGSNEVKADFEKLDSKFTAEIENIQAISLGSAYSHEPKVLVQR